MEIKMFVLILAHTLILTCSQTPRCWYQGHLSKRTWETRDTSFWVLLLMCFNSYQVVGAFCPFRNGTQQLFPLYPTSVDNRIYSLSFVSPSGYPVKPNLYICQVPDDVLMLMFLCMVMVQPFSCLYLPGVPTTLWSQSLSIH